MDARRPSLSRYIPPSSDPLTHFKIVRGETRRRFEDPPCLLARAWPDAAREAVQSLLTEGGSLEFGLRCKDGRELRYYWNRQFDDFTTSMFIIGEQLPASRSRTQPVLPLSAAAL